MTKADIRRPFARFRWLRLPSRRSLRLPLRRLGVVAAAVLLASCGGGRVPDIANLEDYEPKISRTTFSMFINISPVTQLSFQLAYLRSLAEGFGRPSKMYYRLTTLPGALYVEEMKKASLAIRKYLKRMGARPGHIEVTENGHPTGRIVNAPLEVEEGSAILVGVDRYDVEVPACAGFSGTIVAGVDTEQPEKLLGCANAINRALMAASPRDLMEGRRLSPPSAEGAARSLDLLREGAGGAADRVEEPAAATQ